MFLTALTVGLRSDHDRTLLYRRTLQPYFDGPFALLAQPHTLA